MGSTLPVSIARFTFWISILVAAVEVQARPTPDPISGHYYEDVPTFKTWDEARVDAKSRSFGGVAGHLATLSDMNENLIVQHLAGTAERWIGLTDSTSVSMLDGTDLGMLGTFEAGNTSGLPLPPSGMTPGLGERGAGFRWITGEPYTFVNWRPGAPGDAVGGSDAVHTIVQGHWQDTPAGPTLAQPGPSPALKRYAVEYDVALEQPRFHVRERSAASSFNSGTGHIATVALAEELLGLPRNHTHVASQASGQAYVVSFHDPDLGGGLQDYVRHPYLQDVVGSNDEGDFAYQAIGRIEIPTAGDWTFGIMSGDRVQLRIGGNEFSTDGTIASGPPRLTRASDGMLTAVSGGSGETFYFPSAGTYTLELTALERDFSAFIQLFAASAAPTSFDPLTFDLVGDVLNGGLALAAFTTGDFNADGSYSCLDIDALVGEIAAGSGDLFFDLSGDGELSLDDIAVWRTLAGAANLPGGGAYRIGDANLDGVVDGSDFGIWNANKFTEAAAWCRGDFNADGVIDGSDFGLWNGNKFTSSDHGSSAVPEPGTWASLACGWWLLRSALDRRATGGGLRQSKRQN